MTVAYTWTTYPERLQAAGVSWQVYQEEDNYDDNALAWFKPFQTPPPATRRYTSAACAAPGRTRFEARRATHACRRSPG